jgi:hypothetical protein
MIRHCELGIHDLSRVDTRGQLPRFNMPLELGLFLGAQKFGGKKDRRKACLILEGERYQYQRFISDLAGVDPAAHFNQPQEPVGAVRKFLSAHAQATPCRGGIVYWSFIMILLASFPHCWKLCSRIVNQ